MQVTCSIEETEMEGDYGTLPGVVALCLRCGNETHSFGQTGRSVRRCLVLMREACPNHENNYYVADDPELSYVFEE
jgi:hypothetical protein